MDVRVVRMQEYRFGANNPKGEKQMPGQKIGVRMMATGAMMDATIESTAEDIGGHKIMLVSVEHGGRREVLSARWHAESDAWYVHSSV